MNEFMQKICDNLKQEQKVDEQALTRCENQVKDLEVKIRERGYCIIVLEKALGK